MARKSELGGRSLLDVVIRDGIWAFTVVLGEWSYISAATKSTENMAGIVLLVLSMASCLLPPSLGRATAFRRCARCQLAKQDKTYVYRQQFDRRCDGPYGESTNEFFIVSCCLLRSFTKGCHVLINLRSFMTAGPASLPTIISTIRFRSQPARSLQ